VCMIDGTVELELARELNHARVALVKCMPL
jgi:hypothetical protein